MTLGLAGLDFAADIRDIVYDFSHWEWSGKHIGQTILDIIGLVPGIGVVKNIDEAAGLVKNVIKNSDLAEKTAKNVLDKVDEFMPALKRSMDSPSIAPLLGNVMKSSDEAAGVGKKVVKSGDEVSEAVEKTNKAAIKIEQSSTGNNKILWDSWQNYDKVTVNDRIYAKVGNRLYSEHAVNRMQPSGNRFGPNIYQGLNGKDYGRSVAPQFVEDVINSSKPILQQNGNLAYISGTVKVITNPQGMVVTIITYIK